jgi:hypothetical protein
VASYLAGASVFLDPSDVQLGLVPLVVAAASGVATFVVSLPLLDLDRSVVPPTVVSLGLLASLLLFVGFVVPDSESRRLRGITVIDVLFPFPWGGRGAVGNLLNALALCAVAAPGVIGFLRRNRAGALMVLAGCGPHAFRRLSIEVRYRGQLTDGPFDTVTPTLGVVAAATVVVLAVIAALTAGGAPWRGRTAADGRMAVLGGGGT